MLQAERPLSAPNARCTASDLSFWPACFHWPSQSSGCFPTWPTWEGMDQVTNEVKSMQKIENLAAKDSV